MKKIVMKPRRKKVGIGIIITRISLIIVLIVSMFFLGKYLFEIVNNYYLEIRYPIQYQEIVEKYADKYDVPVPLVLAVINCESSFNKDAVSSIGASGLMQFTEDTFDWVKFKMSPEDKDDYTYDDIFEPEVAIKYGCKLLSLLKDEFEHIENFMSAYHAGRSNAIKWLENNEYSNGELIHNIPFNDTSAYVKKVKESLLEYEKMLDAK